ncbi:MAG: aminodeoxychorismate/anthranilate synthase component II [Bacteroidota bacterium]
MRLLIIDNFDSFTYNLVQLFAPEGVEVIVRRNTARLGELQELLPDALCISPGPGTPRDSGVSFDALAYWHTRIPVLGVCLGMQVMNEFFGGRTVHAAIPVHGKAHSVRHDGAGLFTGIPSPFSAARYHSLAIERQSEALEECAWCEDGTVMAVRHISLPLHGVQFHPESFLTQHGARMARNFLELLPGVRR